MPQFPTEPSDARPALDTAKPAPSEVRQALDAANHNAAALSVHVELFIGGGPDFLPALLGTSDVIPGSRVTLDDGSTLTFQDAHELRSVDANTVIMLVLGIPSAVVSAAKIASWLVGRGPKREAVATMTINRHIVEYDEGEICRVIDETIVHTQTDTNHHDD